MLNMWLSRVPMWWCSRTKWSRSHFLLLSQRNIRLHLLILRSCATMTPTSSLLSGIGVNRLRYSVNTCVLSTCTMCSWLCRWVNASNKTILEYCSFKWIRPLGIRSMMPVAIQFHSWKLVCKKLEVHSTSGTTSANGSSWELLSPLPTCWGCWLSESCMVIRIGDEEHWCQIATARGFRLWESSRMCVLWTVYVLHHWLAHYVHHAKFGPQCQ